jgi:leucyl/phenylalanyl-tRNA--protein transferase
MLLSAYRQGIFPWFGDDEPVVWWSPDPRLVLFTDQVHVSRSMQKLMRQHRFQVSSDTDFTAVIRLCARTPRAGQRGTWITEDMELAYRTLHELGFAHSVEVRRGNELAGGLYGLSIGRMFFGESMFSLVPNASKAALILLCRFLSGNGFDVIDAQQQTAHMERMGGRAIPRAEFLTMVSERVERPGLSGPWSEEFEKLFST